MKKRLLAIMMVTVLSFSMLTACGSAAETTEAEEVTEEAVEEEAAEETAEEAEETAEEVAEEADADLLKETQAAYDEFVAIYDEVVKAVDGKESTPEIDDALAQCADLIEQVESTDLTTLSDADLTILKASFEQIVEGLDIIKSAM